MNTKPFNEMSDAELIQWHHEQKKIVQENDNPYDFSNVDNDEPIEDGSEDGNPYDFSGYRVEE